MIDLLLEVPARGPRDGILESVLRGAMLDPLATVRGARGTLGPTRKRAHSTIEITDLSAVTATILYKVSHRRGGPQAGGELERNYRVHTGTSISVKSEPPADAKDAKW